MSPGASAPHVTDVRRAYALISSADRSSRHRGRSGSPGRLAMRRRMSGPAHAAHPATSAPWPSLPAADPPRWRARSIEALVLWFPARAASRAKTARSSTCMGAGRSCPGVSGALGAFRCRPAEPGEFTRRAFHNGKIDLTEVEGLADLVDAETRVAAPTGVAAVSRAPSATQVSAGARAAERFGADRGRDRLFDEGDVGAGRERGRAGAVRRPCGECREDLLQRAKRAEQRPGRLRGRHRRAAQCRQIDLAQCTREARRRDRLGRMPGRRATCSKSARSRRLPVHARRHGGAARNRDPVEQAGIARARAAGGGPISSSGWSHLVRMRWASPMAMPVGGRDVWTSARKRISPPATSAAGRAIADLGERRHRDRDPAGPHCRARVVAYSRRRRGRRADPRSDQRLALRAARRRRLTAVVADPGLPVELVAEDLRLASPPLNMLVGAIDVEDVLGEIFSRFCIGK